MIYHSERNAGGNWQDTFRDLGKTLTRMTRELRAHTDEFDAIICTGTSGLVVASPLSVRLKKKLLVLRKTNENAHGLGGMIIGGNLTNLRILWIDDFVATGKTRTRIYEAVENQMPTCKIVAESMCSPNDKPWAKV